jgi:hypothetical protein
MDGRLGIVADRVGVAADELLEFLDSPAGRRLRRVLATGVIVSLPIVMRIPGLKRTPIVRVLELTGGAALVVKLAELIRDWERDRARPQLTAGSA